MTARMMRMGLLVAAMAMLGSGPAPAAPARANWNNTVAVTPAGNHVLGNPAAKVKLVEYVSYTCSHCRDFERQAGSAMQVSYVAPGKVSVEVRNYVRDPFDMAVALLTNCGPSSRFFLRHGAFLRGQDRWMTAATSAGPLQRRRWEVADFKTRMRNIATDLRLFDIAAAQGVDRRTAEVCLADEAKARRLAQSTSAATASGVSGTPSFLLDGALLAGTHDWRSLDLQLQARF